MTVHLDLRLGDYAAAVHRRVGKWGAADFVARLWNHDPTLWADEDTPEITNRLGWLRLPQTMEGQISELEAFGHQVAAEFSAVVVLGMGGSSLAPEVYQAALGNAPGHPRLFVLDSTHPGAVKAIEKAADPASTLYIVASKSGGTLETMSFFRYFWAIVSSLRSDPGTQFAAITDPGSSLESLARERSFRQVFLADPDVGGRYSALTHFGLVPAAAIGADVRGLVSSAADMANRCSPEANATDNPALLLGATLGDLTLLGRDKVTFLSTSGLAAFPAWLEQLIAESTGKNDTGVVPIGGEDLGDAAEYGADRLFVRLTLADEAGAAGDGSADSLLGAGHPFIDMVLDRPTDLGGAMYLWEAATAAAGAVLGINPFDQPDVQLAKTLASRAMAGELDDTGIDQLTADDPGLAERLTELFGTLRAGDYLGIQAYLAPTEEAREVLQEARMAVRNSRHIATTLDFGPRFLHSTGQLHKGGPNTGVFVQVVDEPLPHLDIPETDYDFGRLITAQANGDLGALAGRRRRVVTITLGDEGAAGLRMVGDALIAAARA